MIITNSMVTLGSQHSQHKSSTEYESLQVYQVDADGSVISRDRKTSDNTVLSDKALKLAKRMGNSNVNIEHQSTAFSNRSNRLGTQINPFPLTQRGSNGPVLNSTTVLPMPSLINNDPIEAISSTAIDPKIKLAAAILSSITGKSIELIDSQSLSASLQERSTQDISTQQFSINLQQFNPDNQPGMGMRYEHVTRYSEAESTTFSASGQIRTSDGEQINVDLMMEMSRSYSTSESTLITAGAQLKDPLVINFAAPAVELSNEAFSFDIDADGKLDHLNVIGPGSGLLTLDKNGDGNVNNGTELFGALSGNGFADLAQYDDDGNQFIDEGDAIYSELKIWVKSADNHDSYFSLADKGVGAIYLGAVQTPFELKNDDNQLQGQVRSSSFFVGEAGNSGTVQQIDLVV